LVVPRHHLNGSPVLRLSSLQACRRYYPGGPAEPRLFRPILAQAGGFGFRGGGLPPCTTGSASTTFVSRLAQRSLALRPACSLSRFCDPLASEASADSLPPQLFRLLPGGTTQLPGRDSHPLENNAFARRTVRDTFGETRLALWCRLPACDAGRLEACTTISLHPGGRRKCHAPAAASPIWSRWQGWLGWQARDCLFLIVFVSHLSKR